MEINPISQFSENENLIKKKKKVNKILDLWDLVKFMWAHVKYLKTLFLFF